MSAYNNTQNKVNNNHCYLKIKRTAQMAGKGVGFAGSIEKNDSLFMEDEPALQTVSFKCISFMAESCDRLYTKKSYSSYWFICFFVLLVACAVNGSSGQ